MNILEAALLGIIQGITEFLPISSSGHLKLVEHFLGFDNLEQFLTFDLVCHLGTLLAILCVFRLRRTFSELTLILMGTLPLIPCLLIYKQVKSLYSAPHLLGFFFLLTSFLLFLGIRFGAKKDEKEPSWKNAFCVGLFQSLALLPGISRSGATISGGRLLGWSVEHSVEFSFLLAIPAIGGGIVWETIQHFSGRHESIPLPFSVYFSGFAVSFAVGFLSLKLLMKLAIKNRFMYFVWYTLILGISVLLYFNLETAA